MTNVTLYQPFEALARRFFDDFEAAPETARGGFFAPISKRTKNRISSAPRCLASKKRMSRCRSKTAF